MKSELTKQATTPELKTKILEIDSNGFNIGTKDLNKQTMRYLTYCNQIKNNNSHFNVQLAREIFKISFGKLFKKQSLPEELLNCIKEENNKFIVDPKFKNLFLNLLALVNKDNNPESLIKTIVSIALLTNSFSTSNCSLIKELTSNSQEPFSTLAPCHNRSPNRRQTHPPDRRCTHLAIAE